MTVVASAFSITPAYDILLRGSESVPVGLYHLHMATAKQLCRLHYSSGTWKAVRAKLKLLEKYGYVQHDSVPTKKVRTEYHYVMGKAGMQYLKDIGLEVNRSFRDSKEIHTNATFIEHSLEVNDVIISAALLHKDDPSYRLARFDHEREFKRAPLTFTYQGEYYEVEPDGFLDFHANGHRLPILLEHDMSTEGPTKFRGRIRNYVAMLYSGAFRERFKVKNSITVAFTTFKGDHRRDQMLGWTKAELERLGVSQNIGLRFVFTSAPKPPDPLNLWLEPCWRTLYDNKAISLLEV